MSRDKRAGHPPAYDCDGKGSLETGEFRVVLELGGADKVIAFRSESPFSALHALANVLVEGKRFMESRRTPEAKA